MKLVRGGIPKRFERIKSTYNDVARDTRAHLGREERILAAYQEFRGAIKEAEALAYEVKTSQEKHVKTAQGKHGEAEDALKAKEGGTQAEIANLQLARDEVFKALQDEEKRLHLLTDLAEHLKVGYNVAETVMAKLQQTHDAKEQVYNRSVTFFGTNEHVFTVLAATYTSQLGLHESTQTLEAMTEGVNKSLETMADIGAKVEERALEAAHGPTVRAEALQKLVDAVVEYQTTSRSTIKELRQANTANVQEIERIVEDGKQRARQAVVRYEST
jgi:ribosomal protein S25